MAMTRLIDADALLEWLDRAHLVAVKSPPDSGAVWTIGQVRAYVLASLCPDQPEGK